MQAVILAAGESSRFWPLNQKHKSLIKIMGKPLICWTIDGLKKSGIKDIIIVQGPKKDVEQELKNYKVKVKYVVQPESKSTGDAVWRARNLIKESIAVVGPHKVDIGEYLPLLLKKFKSNQEKIVLLGVKTDRPEDFGIIKFKGSKVYQVVENPQKGKANFWCIKSAREERKSRYLGIVFRWFYLLRMPMKKPSSLLFRLFSFDNLQNQLFEQCPNNNHLITVQHQEQKRSNSADSFVSINKRVVL